MTSELKKIYENIHSCMDTVKKLKNENYHELYHNNDIRYIDEIYRSLCISAATVNTFMDCLENRNKFIKMDSENES